MKRLPCNRADELALELATREAAASQRIEDPAVRIASMAHLPPIGWRDLAMRRFAEYLSRKQLPTAFA